MRRGGGRGFTLPPPGQPSAAADAADADAPVGADDVGHRVPAGARAPVGEVHRAGSHVRWELLERREERASEGGDCARLNLVSSSSRQGIK